ncbi:MAG: hypothetical protein KJ620_01365 [Candidatus Edwardsbacteria bacterium]|nr:hypothetical protein [Candidatus Edwardsbacteria bacterium]MBU1577032.1 hypothetical protein [Candidatus Edwardsbacteria bacterium]MBU2464550.1 hypothetical protein [Candidatus Edwardsbacteria bacterium]MBU2593413.1 hypothetical protein [Candidatus Edwardsbacteria bacterium]
MRWFIFFIMLFVCLPAHAQQKCELSDSTYWACADSGRLYHVFAESTVTVQTETKGFTFTAIHFELTQGKYGWAGGNDSTGRVVLMRTIDSGKHWQHTMTPVMPKGDGVDRIHFVKGGLLFVLLKSGKALRSNDWGCTYNFMLSPVAGTSYEQGKKLFEESIRHFEERLK